MKSINPFLWFENDAEEAVNFYISLFNNSRIIRTGRYDEESAKATGRKSGSLMIVDFELYGQSFIALNGGPVKDFTFNNSISFFVNCSTEEEINRLYNKLSEGGKVLMPLDKYPFSERFAWINDRFGIPWQLNMGGGPNKITSFLWFRDRAEEAMNYYTSVFSGLTKDSAKNNSEILHLQRFGLNAEGTVGKVQYAKFLLNGQEFNAMDSNKDPFTPAISLFVNCETQAEVDTLWEKLCAGGKPSQCGWLTDKFGVTWQIVPEALGNLMSDPDRVKAARVTKAMLKMTKIEVEELQKAYNG